MKKYLPFILSVLLVFTNTDCKHNPVTPPEDTPGRRDYTWTADTLKVNNGDLFYMSSLWGSSPTDIWAVGYGSSSLVSLWHYDGVSWSRNTSGLSHNLQCIYGLAQNAVWACDAPGNGVYYYNGQQWSNIYYYNGSGTYLYLNNVWGDAYNNIFAVGGIDTIANGNYKGAIMHFDGSTWSFMSLPDYRVDFASMRRASSASNKYCLMATRFESFGDTDKIFEYDGNVIKEFYSGQLKASVNAMEDNAYVCIGQIIYKYQNDQLSTWKDFSGTQHRGRIWGRSEIDFFTVGSNGLTHYNGTDLVTLYPTNLFINDVFVFQQDIFILCNNKIIIHGKLQ